LSHFSGGLDEYLKEPLFRGVHDMEDGVIRVPCPVSRAPKDLSFENHKIADEWFLDNTGVRFRSNAFFTTGRIEEAFGYGELGIMLPVGKFDFCWSPNIKDLYIAIRENVQHDAESGEDFVIRTLIEGDYRLNWNLKAAIASHKEVMVHCDYAYLVTPQWFAKEFGV
jgi:hypothetical protein